METEISTPPFIPIPGYPTGYPSPKRKLGQAWADAYGQLRDAGADFTDGVMLATVTAEKVGLKPSTLVTLFTRAASEGLLEREHRAVESTRGPRTRTHYRLPRV